jgi:peroxiredoxin
LFAPPESDEGSASQCRAPAVKDPTGFASIACDRHLARRGGSAGIEGMRVMELQTSEESQSRVGSSPRVRRNVGAADRIPPAPMGLIMGGQRSRRKRVRFLRAIVGFLFLGLSIAALVWTAGLRRKPFDRNPGQVIGDFQLTDVNTGQVHRLGQHRGRVVVLVFIGTSCPIGDLYMPRLAALATRYRARGVDFLAIGSNASESIEDLADYSRENGANIPILKDPENRVADQLLAERTCETLVVDGRRRLRYRGAIDDQYGRRAHRDQPEGTYLADAIEDVLAGRAVSTEITQVAGCPIERTAPAKASRPGRDRIPTSQEGRVNEEPAPTSSPRPARAPLTYADDVASIVHARCAPCHRPGQVAPFSLLTYQDARRWSTAIAEVLNDGRMPPWHADPRYGRFDNDRSLSARERSLLLSWVDQSSPPGDLSRSPRPPRYSQVWSIGNPDIVFEMPEPFPVPREGTVPIHRIRVASGLTEDLYVQAVEAQPGDRAVVHHICVFVEDPAQTPETRNIRDSLLAAYTPGDRPSVFPPGLGKKIPRGSDLLFEVHYTPIGKPRLDRSSLGVIVSPQPPRHLVSTKGIPAHHLRIPPGDPDHVVRTVWRADRDIQLLSLTPHMHLRGKSFTFTAEHPDGHTEILLSVPRYDFNWQSVYRLVEPKSLPKGTKIHCEAHYDNSSENPANPDPTRTVTWGEQSEDEMMIGFIDYY